MALIFPYRFLVIVMTSLGFIIAITVRSAFSLVVTHTTRKKNSDGFSTSFYSNCTSYNTSTDYVSNYDQSIGMQFHAVYYLAILIFTILSGHIVSRFPCHRVLGFAICLSSVLCLILPTVYQLNTAGVFIIRFLQGSCDAMLQPCATLIASSWSSAKEKSTFLSIALIGLYLSPAITNVMVGACICYVSWDSGLYICGASGVLWSLVWIKIGFEVPQDCPFISKKELDKLKDAGENRKKSSKNVASNIPWREILISKAVWAIFLANLYKVVITTSLLSIMPFFYLDVFGIKAADSGILLSVPFVLKSFFTFLASYLADRLITSGCLSTILVRKGMQCIGSLTSASCFVGMVFANTWQTSYALLLIADSVDGITVAGFKCNILDLSIQYSGAVMAVTMTSVVGAFGVTMFSSFVTGMGNALGDWAVLFLLEASLASITAVVYFLFAKAERQSWDAGTDICYEVIPCTPDVKKSANEKTLLRP